MSTQVSQIDVVRYTFHCQHCHTACMTVVTVDHIVGLPFDFSYRGKWEGKKRIIFQKCVVFSET